MLCEFESHLGHKQSASYFGDLRIVVLYPVHIRNYEFWRIKKGLRRLATETVCCVESEGINPR